MNTSSTATPTGRSPQSGEPPRLHTHLASTEVSSTLTVSGIDIEVVYKDIKNLHISVYPPAGRVHVASPNRLDEETVRIAIVQRLPWIREQQTRHQTAARQTQREMVSGETHYVWGRPLLLDVSKHGRTAVAITGNHLHLTTPATYDAEQRLAALENWYRGELKAAIPQLLGQWVPVVLGRQAGAVNFVVRRMKTKWGTCHSASNTIWLNLELAKKDPLHLEYVVVHELVHFIERTHNSEFIALLDQHLPDWESRREDLNGAPLAAFDLGNVPVPEATKPCFNRASQI